jgi:hypothetical protein
VQPPRGVAVLDDASWLEVAGAGEGGAAPSDIQNHTNRVGGVSCDGAATPGLFVMMFSDDSEVEAPSYSMLTAGKQYKLQAEDVKPPCGVSLSDAGPPACGDRGPG